jgi:hypothetical protein
MLTRTRDRSRIVLIFDALVFGGLGIWFLATPATALSAVGFTLNDAAALTEARAMYGGYELGTAAFLYACAREPGWRRAGLTLAILVLGGLGLTRLIAGALTGGLTPMMLGLFAAEALGVAANVAALSGAPRGR